MKLFKQLSIWLMMGLLAACGGKSTVKSSSEYSLAGKPVRLAAEELKRTLKNAEEVIYLSGEATYINAIVEITPWVESVTQGYEGNRSRITEAEIDKTITVMESVMKRIIKAYHESEDTRNGVKNTIANYNQYAINVKNEWAALKGQRNANASVLMTHAFGNMTRGLGILSDLAAGKHLGLPCFGVVCD